MAETEAEHLEEAAELHEEAAEAAEAEEASPQDNVVVEASPTIIVEPPAAPEAAPAPDVGCHCLTVMQFEEVIRRVILDLAADEEPEPVVVAPEPKPEKPKRDVAPKPSHPFFRKRGE